MKYLVGIPSKPCPGGVEYDCAKEVEVEADYFDIDGLDESGPLLFYKHKKIVAFFPQPWEYVKAVEFADEANP